MQKFAAPLIVLSLSCLLTGGLAQAQDVPPVWAFVVAPPDFKPPPDDGKLRQVPDSTASYSVPQTRDRFFAPDWHPDDHPKMPEIVTFGRKPDVFACGFCHRADGPGGPENASLAGLPAAYIVQQMVDFKTGARKTTVPQRGPGQLMISLAKGATDEEIKIAAAYFAAAKPRATIMVVETNMVPKTYVAGVFFADMKTGEKEPIGERIIEVPQDVEQFENRDARSRFIAYVPSGSVKKGEALAAGEDAGKTLACRTCHGPDLRGVDAVPGIAGRSPSYIVRQLYDFKQGARAGSTGAPMKPVVEKLTVGDMTMLAAYLASLTP
jgi:cytochrome c553